MAIETWDQPVRRRAAKAVDGLRARRVHEAPSVGEAIALMTTECYAARSRQNARDLLGGGRFQRFLASREIVHIGELSRRDIRAFHEGLRDVLSEETRNKYRQYLNRLIDWCAATPGYTMAADSDGASSKDVVLRKAKVPRDEVRVIGPSEEVALRAVITTARDETILDVLLASGLRPGELCGLAVHECHLTPDHAREAACADPVPHVHVRRSGVGRRTTKDFETRVAPVTAAVARRLARWLKKERPTTTRREVFLSVRRAGDGDFLPLTPEALQSVFQRLSSAAQIDPPLVPYDTRHSWATRLADAGFAPPHLMQAGGWADLQMVMRYYRLDTRRMLEEFNRRFRG